MNIFKRARRGSAAVAVAEAPREPFEGTAEELDAEIRRLTESNRNHASRETERRILALRHQAGAAVLEGAGERPDHAAPDATRLPGGPGLPEFTIDELTPELLRAAILRDGCALVRGLISREDALLFAGQIDSAFEERERQVGGGSKVEGLYEPFQPQPEHEFEDGIREWIRQGGGVLAMDSPQLAAGMFDRLDAAGLPALIEGYLGERPLLSVQKTTLRKATPDVSGAWHQDGKFMGDVRALNLWLSLSRCGDVAPGLDIVPRRLNEFVSAGTEGALLDYAVEDRIVNEVAGDTPVIRPIFEPGDALLFDDLFLHQTGSDPSMPNPRYALESWYFGGSGFPEDYAPIAV